MWRNSSERREDPWKDAPPPATNVWAQPKKTKDLKAALLGQSSAASPAASPATMTSQIVPDSTEASRATTAATSSAAEAEVDTQVEGQSGSRIGVIDAEDEAESSTRTDTRPASSGVEGTTKYDWAEEMAAEAEGSSQPYSPTKTTVLEMPVMKDDTRTPDSAMTTMTDLIGHATEQEREGRKLVQGMRDKMEERLEKKGARRREDASLDRSEGPESSTAQDICHPSAMPQPLHLPKRDGSEPGMRERMRRMFSKSKTNKDEKPLPSIPDSGNPYDPASSAYIHGAYIPSPVTPRHDGPSYLQAAASMLGSYQPQGQEPDPRAPAYSPIVDWALPSQRVASVTPAPQVTGRILPGQAANSVDSNTPSPDITRYNQNSGIILSHGHFHTPTRYQGFATRHQPQIAHPPSQHSFVASIIVPQSPSYMSPTSSRPPVTPEPKATKEERYAAADPVEDIYNRDEDSASTPDLEMVAELDAEETETRPTLPRSNSMPAKAISTFMAADAASNVTTAGADALPEGSGVGSADAALPAGLGVASADAAPPADSGVAFADAALPAGSGDASADTAPLAASDVATPASAPPIVISTVVNPIFAGLNQLHVQFNEVEARLVANQQAAIEEMRRRLGTIETQNNRMLTIISQNGGAGGSGARGGRGGRGGGRGGGMASRLAGVGPHIPYGGQQNGI